MEKPVSRPILVLSPVPKVQKGRRLGKAGRGGVTALFKSGGMVYFVSIEKTSEYHDDSSSISRKTIQYTVRLHHTT